MTPVKASSFGRRIGCARDTRAAGGTQHLAHRLDGPAPKRRAAARSLNPSTYTLRRTAA